jgi:hypothetical protein
MSTVLDFKSVLIALLPNGHIWNPKPGGDFDLMLDAEAENIQLIHDRLAAAADVRNPRKTTMLSDLEKEYRTVPESVLTEAERRVALANIIYQPISTGGADFLQARLQENGFNLVVQHNSPAIDPRILADIDYQMVADGGAAFAGNAAAFAGVSGGEIIVNQKMYTQDVAYEAQADGASTFAGNQFAVAGYFNDLHRELIEYSLDMHFGYWSCVFFIAESFSGWIPLRDWSMEKPGNVDWIPGPASLAEKDFFLTAMNRDEQQSEYQMIADVYHNIPDLNGDKDGVNHGGENTEDSYGPALSFDGISQYASFQQDIFTYTELTYEAVVKINAFQGVDDVPLFGDAAFSFYGTGLYIFQDIITMKVGLGSGVGPISSAGFKAELDRYYHIVGTWSNGNTIKLYIDGKLYDNNVYVTGTIDQTVNLLSGSNINLSVYQNCEVAYATYYDEEKDQDWVNARHFDLMREGGRRLRVAAVNNTGVQQLSPYPFDPDLIHEYCTYLYPGIPGGDGVFDLIGNSDYDGDFTTNVNSIYGRGMSFNGTTSTLGGPFYYTSTEFCLEIIAKVNAYPAADAFIVGSGNQAGDALSLHGITANSGNNIWAFIYVNSVRYYTATYAMTTGVYHHIAMSWISGETLKLYVDGSLVAQSAVVTGTIDAFTSLTVGVDLAGPSFLNCETHRLSVYKKKKELAYIQSRYNEMLDRKICDLTMYARVEGDIPSGIGPSRDYTIEDITTNQYGYPTDITESWTKWGRSLIFNGLTSKVDLYLAHPVMANIDHTISILVKKTSGSTPATQPLVSNGSSAAGTTQHLYLDLSAYPTISATYDISSAVGGTITGISGTVNDIETEYYHIVATRYWDSVNTQLKLYINGALSNSTSFVGLPNVTVTPCLLGFRSGSDYLDGEVANLKMYSEEKNLAWVQAEYADILATDMEFGSYAEQILDTPITSSIDISGVASGDGVGARPYLMVQDPSTSEWSTIWEGNERDDLQHFTAEAPNGLSAIRLYNGLSNDGFVSWDDISVIDPQVVRGQVSAARKDKLKQLILQYKPLGTWCILITDYV